MGTCGTRADHLSGVSKGRDMADNDLFLMAHLMRRAGFGTTRGELEAYVARGYENVVEDLLHPERFPDDYEDLLERYYLFKARGGSYLGAWMYRMVNSKAPLKERMALFCHHMFPTSGNKVQNGPDLTGQIEMFRSVGLSNLRTILTELSKDPAMIFWLDNSENHKDDPNENYGRELLELFSMGQGNYTEQDIKMAARAFTGWTFTQPIHVYAAGHRPSRFVYREEDHDDSVKTFLGETGRFNGEDILGIIVKHPATARFIARHFYNFFVADEPPVSTWSTVPPQDPQAIDTLVNAYVDSSGDVRSILRVLFNAEFFKAAQFKKIKSPTELVVNIIMLVGTYRFPDAGIQKYPIVAGLMGQQLLQPETVEGWHNGKDWIDGSSLAERVNFAMEEVGDAAKPGIRSMIDRLSAGQDVITPAELVDRCLDAAGPLVAGSETKQELHAFAESGRELRFETESDRQDSEARIMQMLRLIVATREFQFA